MESITWLVDKNRLSPVEKVQVRLVAKDQRVVCDHVERTDPILMNGNNWKIP
jgi:hypothetical protein